MIYLWIIVSFVVTVAIGIRFEGVKNGSPRPFASHHCARNYLPFAGPEGQPCMATVQDYGWPLVTSKRYTDVRGPDGRHIFPLEYTDRVFEERNNRGTYGRYSAITPNIIIAGAIAFTPLIIAKIRANRHLNKEYNAVLAAEKHRPWKMNRKKQ